MGAKGYVLSCLALNGPTPRGASLWVTFLVPRTPFCGYRGSKHVLSQVSRRCQSGLTGGEILPAHGHCVKVEETGTDQPRSSSFWLVVPLR
jgi:hypothetical protein